MIAGKATLNGTATNAVTLLLSSAALASSFILVWGFDGENDTTSSTSPMMTSDAVPFPGSSWLESVITPTSVITFNDKTYASAYAALLDNDPANNPFRNFNEFINSFFFSSETASKFISAFGVDGAHYALCYCRNFLSALVVYYGTAGIFHYYCYAHPRTSKAFKERLRPSREIIIDQIKMAQAAMFLYVALPVFADWLVEESYTQAYYTLSEIGGLGSYLAWLIVYFTCVEIGIYWMHRTLHTNKFLYKYIHMKHHKYNKPETLSPWASIAFNPIDGILQASPYVFFLLFIPCHYITHMAFVFFTAIWATYIHDAMDWNVDPIMGSKYHTVHHTHYVYNYGQIFIFCDWFWGTLRVPCEKTGVGKQRLEEFGVYRKDTKGARCKKIQ